MMKTLTFIFTFLFLLSQTKGQKTKDTLKSKKYYYVYNHKLNNHFENFQAGYIDTFSIINSKFRVLLNDEDLLKLEFLQKGKWTQLFTFDYSQWGYLYDKDFDNDGIADFAVSLKWNYDVHSFKKKTGNFLEDGFTIYESNKLIDKKRNIYSDCQTYNYTHDKVYSDLYQIKNGHKELLYRLVFKKFHNGNNYTYSHIASFYKCSKNSKDKFIRRIKFNKSIEGDLDNFFHFDYEKFWKKYLKEKMGYS